MSAAEGSPGDRRWLEVAVRLAEPATSESPVPDTLIGLGARGVVEERGRHVAYFEEPDDLAEFLHTVRRALSRVPGIGEAEVEHGWQAHEEWAETWRRGLGPRRVGDRIVVRPSWTKASDAGPDDLVIVLDPGMAFGTAEHGTTRGCLRLLERTVGPGERVLDVGAGSGILSIAAALLGAGEVVAIEGDPLAREAMEENLRGNGVADRVQLVAAWTGAADLAARGPVDGIVANIETHLLSPLFAGFRSALADGGWLVVSGILEAELDGVLAALAALGFALVDVDADGEWRSARLEPRAS